MLDQGTTPLVELNVTAPVTGKPVWLAVQPEPVFGVLHMPSDTARTRLAALILPTFGWDNDCSYRARRHWATSLANAGVAAARIDFPGTENSVGSPTAPNRVQSWIDATTQAARWLRDQSGCERLVAIGIGLGGLVAYQAVVQEAPIDDLILWGTRASGRAYLRELRTYATVGSGAISDAPEPAREDGSTGIAGHVMSQETATALSAVKIEGVPLPQADRRRVLLIGRDAHGIDAKLQNHLEGSGAEVTLIEADDYHRLMALPELRFRPDKTISASITWMNDAGAGKLEPITHVRSGASPGTSDSVELEYDGADIRERIVELDTTPGRVIGIISEPVGTTPAPYCLVIVNSGELRHTGPNRVLVEVARRAAALGVPAARFDLPGLGDSDGDWVRTFERTVEDDAHALAVMDEMFDHLQRLRIAERFIPTGLCLGAYLALRAVLENDRSIGAISINPPTFKWTTVQQNTLRRGLAAMAPEVVTPAPRGPRLPRPLRPAAAQVMHALRVFDLFARRHLAHFKILWRFARRSGRTDASRALDQLAAVDRPVLLLLSQDEPVLWLLEQPRLTEKLVKCRKIEMEILPTHDHNLRPLVSQQTVLDRISVALHDFWDSPGGSHGGPELE